MGIRLAWPVHAVAFLAKIHEFTKCQPQTFKINSSTLRDNFWKKGFQFRFLLIANACRGSFKFFRLL